HQRAAGHPRSSAQRRSRPAEDLTRRPSSATAAEEGRHGLLQSDTIAVALYGSRPYALDHGQFLDIGETAVLLAVTDNGLSLCQTDTAQRFSNLRRTGLVDVDRDQRRFAHFGQGRVGKQDTQTQHDGAYQ